MFEGKPRSEIEHLIDEWIVNMTNAERNREIMKRRYIDGVTYDRLAFEFDMSEWQIKYIVKTCGEKIKDV
jgi:hypothetical protein